MKEYSILDQSYEVSFPQHGDERGWLVVVEGMKDIPFDIKRIFYIYGSDGDVIRGRHANRKSEFILVNVAGSCKVRLDDGRGKEKIIVLDQPHKGIYIPKMLWKDMYDFSNDSILLCLSSQVYDNEEYIRDYEEYKKEMRK
ncbi:MAG: FdtA/QdtA family cupin domain-containing protein [Bacillota bacterium]|nr:FdtA/QdtA family cupin domain-containing protein [Bacillota bacterium]